MEKERKGRERKGRKGTTGGEEEHCIIILIQIYLVLIIPYFTTLTSLYLAPASSFLDGKSKAQKRRSDWYQVKP